jgi:CBS domain-containing protein
MTDDAISFLGSILPFNQIVKAELLKLARTLGRETFPAESVIITQQSKGVRFYIIKSGLVKVYLVDEKGQEKVLGFLGEGDCFGEVSLLTDGLTTANILTMEETVCYTQKKEDFLAMVQRHPVFLEFFNQLLTQRMRSIYRKILMESPEVGQVEPLLFSKQIKDLLTPKDYCITGNLTLRQAAEKVVQENLEALIILNGQNKLTGVLDRKDLLQALLDRIETGSRVAPLARKDFKTIDREGYFFEALHEMVKHKTSFLVVLKGEEPEGLLTSLDLLRFRGREALSLIRNIENATGLDQLYHWRLEAEKVIRALMADGALASQVCRIVSELNDKIVRKIIQFTGEKSGPEPCAYSWLGLGSEGRKEQSLFTDQDNALIIADAATDQAKAYFQDFARKVVEGLDHCGIPLCKGGGHGHQPKIFRLPFGLENEGGSMGPVPSTG